MSNPIFGRIAALIMILLIYTNQSHAFGLNMESTYKFGEAATNNAVTIIINSVRYVDDVLLRHNQRVNHFQPGTKFVELKILFKNSGKVSLDIYCSYNFVAYLYDKSGRRFDKIEDHHKIIGNTGCNDSIQPGFSTKETIIFEISEDAIPDKVQFCDPDDNLDCKKSSIIFPVNIALVCPLLLVQG